MLNRKRNFWIFEILLALNQNIYKQLHYLYVNIIEKVLSPFEDIFVKMRLEENRLSKILQLNIIDYGIQILFYFIILSNI